MTKNIEIANKFNEHDASSLDLLQVVVEKRAKFLDSFKI